MSGIADSTRDVDRVDLFIGDVAVATRKRNAGLDLLDDESKANIVGFAFTIDVAMNSLPAKVTMKPGLNHIHVYATTSDGQCGKNEVDFNARQPRVFAVIVGVNEPNNQLRPLQYAYTDALAFKDYLEKDLGVPPGNIALLPDKPGSLVPADKTNISEQLENLKDLKVEADTVFFFFSGHGVLIDGEQYLVPMRGNIAHPIATLLKLDTVEDFLKQSKARRRLFFVDACNIGEANGQRGLTAPTVGRKGPEEDLTQLWSNWTGSFGIAASLPTEPSWEHPSITAGVFTHFLLEAFRKARADDKHRVTLRAAYDYVNDAVPKFAGSAVKPTVTVQHPYLIDNTGEAGQIEIGYH